MKPWSENLYGLNENVRMMKPKQQYSVQIESEDEDHDYDSRATERNLITQTIDDRFSNKPKTFESPATNSAMRRQPGLGQSNAANI